MEIAFQIGLVHMNIVFLITQPPSLPGPKDRKQADPRSSRRPIPLADQVSPGSSQPAAASVFNPLRWGIFETFNRDICSVCTVDLIT